MSKGTPTSTPLLSAWKIALVISASVGLAVRIARDLDPG